MAVRQPFTALPSQLICENGTARPFMEILPQEKAAFQNRLSLHIGNQLASYFSSHLPEWEALHSL